MKKATSWTSYEERLSRVSAYIYDHLDEEMDLNKLADIAYMSPYHWHRIYHAVHGETIAETVKRLRLHRAAGYLAQTSMTVGEIAERSGYKNLQSFTRIFRSVYGMPPAQYREKGSHTQFQSHRRRRPSSMNDIAIKTLPNIQLVTVPHVGSYMLIGKAFDILYRRLGARMPIGTGLRSIGLFYDDPATIPEEKLRSRAGVIVDENSPIELPLERTEIPGGPYAVLRHKGPYADMKASYEWLYGEWLMKSGREAADAPLFEEYINSPRDTAPTELITDIYLPLDPVRVSKRGVK